MKTVCLAADAAPRLTDHFKTQGYRVRLIRTDGMTSAPLACHPDMFMCRLGVSSGAPIISCLDDSKSLRPSAVYPADIPYNAACTGKYFIHNLRYTSPALLREAERLGMTMVDVRQGYAKCSTVIVDEDSVITYDMGMARACERAGLAVLTVEAGHVLLPGYDTGFIGGASGRVGDTVYFNGDLSAHPDHERIIDFIRARGLSVKWFPDWSLTDIGSIIEI